MGSIVLGVLFYLLLAAPLDLLRNGQFNLTATLLTLISLTLLLASGISVFRPRPIAVWTVVVTWCLLAAATLFLLAKIAIYQITRPDHYGLAPFVFALVLVAVFLPTSIVMLRQALAWGTKPRHHRSTTLCQHCGFDMRTTPDLCPECGQKPLPWFDRSRYDKPKPFRWRGW